MFPYRGETIAYRGETIAYRGETIAIGVKRLPIPLSG